MRRQRFIILSSLSLVLLLGNFSLATPTKVADPVDEIKKAKATEAQREEESKPSHLRTLVGWELFRMEGFSDETKTGIEKNTKLGKKITEAIRETTKEQSKKKVDGASDRTEGEAPKAKEAADEITLKELKSFFSNSNEVEKLSDDEWKDLLGTLRITNAVLRGADKKTAAKTLIDQELAAAGEKPVRISDPSVRKALEKEFEEKTGNTLSSSPKANDLRTILDSESFKNLDPEKKRNLLSDIRSDKNLSDLAKDFDREARDDYKFELKRAGIPDTQIDSILKGRSLPPLDSVRPERKASTSPPTSTVPQPKEAEFVPPRRAREPSNSGSGGDNGGHNPRGGSNPRPRQGGGSPEVMPGGRGSSFGSIISDGNPISIERGGQQKQSFKVPEGFFGEKSQLDSANPEDRDLIEMIRNKKTSLRVTINGNALCQLTIHSKKDNGSGSACQMTASSAKHCFESAGSRPTLDMDGIPEAAIEREFTEVKNSAAGGDVSLIRFRAVGPCSNYEHVPSFEIADQDGNSKNEGKSVILSSRWGFSQGRLNVVGKLSDQVPSDVDTINGSALQIDVRQNANGSLGIFQGDSGGGAFVMGNDGKLQMVGVLSSKIVGSQYENGIGFIAGRSDLAWLKSEVSPGKSQPNLQVAGRNTHDGGSLNGSETSRIRYQAP